MRTTQACLIVTIPLLLLAGACKKDEPTTVDLGHGYFPATPGRWVLYNVDSMSVHDTEISTWNYQIKEVLTEDFTDLEGRPAQRLIRYKLDSNNLWIPKDVWWQVRENVRAERVEENMRRVKLVFPPRYATYWNTNARNTQVPFELNYEEVDEPWNANGLSFDSTVLVTGTYEPNIINSKTYKERYAKNIGLVYRLVDSSETQTGSNPSFDRYRVEYTVTAFGQ